MRGVLVVEANSVFVSRWFLSFACASVLAAGQLVLSESAGAGLKLISETARKGPVYAEFTYYKETGKRADGYRDAWIWIRRDGKTLVNRHVELQGCRKCEVWPLKPRKSLRVSRTIDADREPEILLRLYTGGARCCRYDRIYDFSRRSWRYRIQGQNWGEARSRLTDLRNDGRFEFVSSDKRFLRVFTNRKSSAGPIRIWRFAGGRFDDVTKKSQYRSSIRRDARQLWRRYERVRESSHPEVRGILAAWLADKHRLKQGESGWQTMQSLSAGGEFDFGEKGPYGSAYLRELRQLLARTGYSR